MKIKARLDGPTVSGRTLILTSALPRQRIGNNAVSGSKVVSFPPANELEVISILSPNALLPGQAIAQTVEGLTYDITVNNRIDATGGNFAVVSVLDPNGNPVPIGDFILALINRQVGGILINFSNAPIDPEALITLPDIPEEFQADFARFFLAVQEGNPNAKLLVSGFTTYTESEFNSNYNLSQGDDAILTTTLSNVIYGNDGNDAFVVTAYSENPNNIATTSYLSLGEGNDEVSITKQALKQNGSKIEIENFNSNEDTLALDIKAKKVNGIGTDRIRISANKKSRFIVSTFDGSKITKDAIDFI
ncbi:hypothetical protein [Synechococcus sp. CBW1006]|uniref:hypothetical protein n=1 Tax=Synechococcus sp. CBW1006 TaxID=1353138 RepID=UPI0018CE2ED1|nr:hypothetical protein [Synechococcus sp. CBW1006]QPN65891.1 hypothetical protein H8F26_13575 [Synechococcus sp. CBW1006]